VRLSFEMLKTLKEVAEDEHGDSPQ
jgi:hypothetical protein